MAINIFKHGYRNDVHSVIGFHEPDHFLTVSVSTIITADPVCNIPVHAPHVWVTLYGSGWTKKDIERSSRQDRVLFGCSLSTARQVRDHLLHSFATGSIPLSLTPLRLPPSMRYIAG